MSDEQRLRIHLTIFSDWDHQSDSESLEKIFKDEFKLRANDINAQNNRTKVQIVDHLESFASKRDGDIYEKYDIFFFIFLASQDNDHGPYTLKTEPPEDACKSDNFIRLEEIFDTVKNKPCLVMKPKIFIVQADDENLRTRRKGPQVGLKTVKIPSDSDRLLIFSTIPYILKDTVTGGKVVLPRDKEDRSFLVDAFINVFKEPGNRRQDFLTLTTSINKRVGSHNAKAKSTGSALPLPLVSSTLTKLLYL